MASLQHDANYILTAYAIKDTSVSGMNELKAYISRCQDWLQIISNNLVNVNNSIDSLIKSTQRWSEVINNNLLNENSKTQSIDEKMVKILQDKQKDREERQNAQRKSDEARKDFDSKRDEHKPNTANLSSLVSARCR